MAQSLRKSVKDMTTEELWAELKEKHPELYAFVRAVGGG